MADLPVEGRHRRGVDDDATFAIVARRLVFLHLRGAQPKGVEGADQVDLNDAVEVLQGQRSVAAHRARRGADAGAIDVDMDGAKRRHHRLDGRFAGCRVRDVDRKCRGAGADVPGRGTRQVFVQIEQRDSGTCCCESLGGGAAQARGAAGNHRHLVFQVHV